MSPDPETSPPDAPDDVRRGMVRVRGASENNLRHVDVDIPRDAVVAFTGVSGSGKSSLAFGTVWAEAQRRYLESVAPYARRLIQQGHSPAVEEITGLPPAVALQQRRGTPGARSTVGTLTTLSNSVRMLFSRAGTYPADAPDRLESDAFSANTAAGACPECSGLGTVHDVTEDSLVPDPRLSIRDGAVAAWPGAWQGKNLQDILVHLGHDVDAPWRELPRELRDWILFTEEEPVVDVTPLREKDARPYKGRFRSARGHVLRTLAESASRPMRERALRFVVTGPCRSCRGSGLRPEALAVSFSGRSIAELNRAPLEELADVVRPTAGLPRAGEEATGERSEAAVTIARDLASRLQVLLDLGLGYLSLDRAAPTLSPGELQRLRIATQLRSGLFGVVYVLDEPSAGLHPADAEPLLAVLEDLKDAGNSVFVVEHDMAVVRRADWVVDVGPQAGDRGGRVLYSGPPAGLEDVPESATRPFLLAADGGAGTTPRRAPRTAEHRLRLTGITRHNLAGLDVEVPLGVLTAVTGVSGSGKSTLVSQVLAEAVGRHVQGGTADDVDADPAAPGSAASAVGGVAGLDHLDRLIRVDQRPIGRTPRSNLATYTGLFDAVRKLYAATDEARARGWGPGRFSFNVAGGRCETCQGEGFLAVELLFLPGTYGPCPDCRGARYNPGTLEIVRGGRSIADVLDLRVETAVDVLADVPAAGRSLRALLDVGLGYLRLGQPATELSGGEAQRIKLATELQRARRGRTLYLLDEPTTGLHPQDVELLMRQLQRLVDAGSTVVVVEHDMSVVAQADWVIDMGPSGGGAGGRVVSEGTPADVAGCRASRTAPYLAAALAHRA
ncbi:excinuclease ABC subunit UvrA [Kocuria sp. M1R5S2]|uniref:excinuclease ABC subunit UvrA n=1 Tax=Kocuria rhizosphaerae TaxID=3376285 RepID=UPI0037A4F790